MLEFEHGLIAQICGKSPDDVKVVLDVIRPYLSNEQIFEINKDAQETFDNIYQEVLNNPEDFGLI